MAITDANGNVLTKAQLLAKTTDVTYPADKKFTETIFETFTYRGKKDFEGGRRQKFFAGQTVAASLIDSLYSTATVASIVPQTGIAAAGGATVTVNGTGFGGATGATVGGTNVTNFKRVSATKVTFTVPAKTAGTQALIIIDDGGNVAAGNLTYV